MFFLTPLALQNRPLCVCVFFLRNELNFANATIPVTFNYFLTNMTVKQSSAELLEINFPGDDVVIQSFRPAVFGNLGNRSYLFASLYPMQDAIKRTMSKKCNTKRSTSINIPECRLVCVKETKNSLGMTELVKHVRIFLLAT